MTRTTQTLPIETGGLKSNALTAADGADTDLPPQSALENNGTAGWTTRADA